MRWQTCADERDDPRFIRAGAAAQLLYIHAGAWAMEQVFNKRVPLPDTWFIPSRLIREWGKQKPAAALVRESLWARDKRGGAAGFVYEWIRYENTPLYIEHKREEYRREHKRRRAAKRPN